MPDHLPRATKQAMARPGCQKCGTAMVLTRMAPDGAGYLCTFECPDCKFSKTENIRFD
jgi:hypothetical protein